MLEKNPNQILQNIINKSTQELSVMPDELLTIYNGLNVLQEWVKQQAKQPSAPLIFEKWIQSVPQKIQKEIEQKTNQAPLIFAQKTDAVAQSYRLYKSQKIPPVSEEQKLVQEYWSLIPFLFEKTGFSDALNVDLYQD